MALRFDNISDSLSRTTNLPTITSFTVMLWVNITNDRNAITTFVALGDATGTVTYELRTGSNGTTLELWNGSTAVTGSALTPGTWAHIALVVSGTGAGQAICYVNSVSNITHAGNASVTAGKLFLGNDASSQWLDGRIAGVKIYDAVLTALEIRQEFRQYAPYRTENLNTLLPCIDAAANDNAIDLSGSGNSMTVGGTLTVEGGPQASWSTNQPIVLLPTLPTTGTGDVSFSFSEAAVGDESFLAAGGTSFVYSEQGTGAETFSGAAALSMTFSEAATGAEIFAGTGNCTYASTWAATGSETFSGTGNAAFNASLLGAGNVVNPTIGTGALTFLSSLAATGKETFSGTGSTVFTAALAGTGAETFAGTGSCLYGSTVAATGSETFAGTGTLAFVFSESGTGIGSSFIGTGTAVFAQSIAGTGIETFSGTAALSLVFSEAGTALQQFIGTSAATFGIGVQGAGVVVLPPVTGDAALSWSFSCQASGGINSITGTGTLVFAPFVLGYGTSYVEPADYMVPPDLRTMAVLSEHRGIRVPLEISPPAPSDHRGIKVPPSSTDTDILN